MARSSSIRCASIPICRTAFVLVVALVSCLPVVEDRDPETTAYNAKSAGEQLPAPDYAVDLSGVAVETDARGVVADASGTVHLLENAQTGEFYVIDSDETLDSSFAAIDDAYTSGIPVEVNTTIRVESFELIGQTLPAVRNLIVLHSADGVKTYQVLRITFSTGTSRQDG